MSWSRKAHKRNSDGSFEDPKIEATRTDCQKADDKRTERSHQKSCDIHEIMRKTVKTGVQQHVSKHEGTYGDYLGVPEYQEAQNQIAAAKSMFESIPAEIRSKFDNRPEAFIDWIQNENNKDEIQKAGFSAEHLECVKSERKEQHKQKVKDRTRAAAEAAHAASAVKTPDPGAQKTK